MISQKVKSEIMASVPDCVMIRSVKSGAGVRYLVSNKDGDVIQFVYQSTGLEKIDCQRKGYRSVK